MITREGGSQILRRLLSAVLFSTGLIFTGAVPLWWAAVLMLAGSLVYGLWPRPPRGPGDLLPRQWPSVIGPDLLGFSLTAFFVALPIWIGRGEGTEGLHVSASVIWIMAAGSSTLLFVGAMASCFRLRIDADGMLLTRLFGETRLLWPQILGWKRWRRGLPGAMRKFVPFLPPGPAGAILLARDSTGVELHLKDGRKYRLPREGFEHGEKQLLQALAAQAVLRLPDIPEK